jgi:catechol 2,3-dioxygenase-like lactoylglutathione lyase family enzyme
MRKLVLTGFGLLAAGSILSGAASAQTPAKPSAIPDVRMGTKPQEMYLAKITVSDLQRSLEFYTKVVGLKLVTSPDMKVPEPPKASDPEKDFVEVALNYSGSMAEPLFVVMKRKGKTPPKEFASLVTIGFKVPSTKAVIDRAAQAGFQPLRPFGGDGQPAFLTDPDGYGIELVQGRSFDK